MRVLDGSHLAQLRRADLTARAARVAERRGRRPRLLLVAFGPPGAGAPPHVGRKLRACAETGVDVVPLILAPDVRTPRAIAAMRTALEEPFDAVFLQFPFPQSLDGDELAAAVPVALDVDIMTPLRIATYMNGLADLPPVTVAAALALLDAYDVEIRDRQAVVVAEHSPFSLMFRAALLRRGARVEPLLRPQDPRTPTRLAGSDLIMIAAAAPGLISASDLPAGSVVIDAGYYNAGGRGDVDITTGTSHLAAFSPVPGGIGPMTVSSLVERVVEFAEHNAPPDQSQAAALHL